MKRQITELLQSSVFSNAAGSIFLFKGDEVIKNEEVIGTFHIKQSENKSFLLFSAPDLGTVEFKMEIRRPDDQPLAIDLYSSNNRQPFLTLVETKMETHPGSTFIFASI